MHAITYCDTYCEQNLSFAHRRTIYVLTGPLMTLT